MLYQIYAMTIHELKLWRRDTGALVTLFTLPIVFIMIMTSMGIGASSAATSANPIELLVVNQDAGASAGTVIDDLASFEGIKLVEEIDSAPLTRGSAEQLISAGSYDIAVLFPAGFSAHLLQAPQANAERQATVTLIADPATSPQLIGPIRSAVRGLVERVAAEEQAPGMFAGTFQRLASQAPAQQAQEIRHIGTRFVSLMQEGLKQRRSQGAAGSSVRIERVAPGSLQAAQLPTAAEQNVPAYTIFGIFWIVQILGVSILREKQEGTFRRLQAAPLARSTLLLGKLVPSYVINLIQVALMFSVGVLVFGMGLGESPQGLLLVTLATSAAAGGLGLCLAASARTMEQLSGLSTMLLITMAAIGGLFVPSFIMPDFMQQVARLTPQAWALSGYQDIIVRGQGLGAVLDDAGMLLAFCALFYGLARWRFKFE